MLRHPEADVLPRKAELSCDFVERRVVGGVVETAEPSPRILTQARVGGEERMDKLPSILCELPEPALNGLQGRDRKQMDSDLERKADVV